MDTGNKLEALKTAASHDSTLMNTLLNTRLSPTPLSDFCKASREVGIELYEMDIIAFGEDSYAAMRRSTNGGGENAPPLRWENDAYEMFMMELEMIAQSS